MSWASAIKGRPTGIQRSITTGFTRPTITPESIDWDHLVALDFETHYSTDYTLSKLSTSEYVRDERFEALMVGIKVGRNKTKVVPGPKIAAELRAIPWSVYSLLCHNMLFDGFILSHHYGVHPKKLYCSLSMARGLHSNDIGAGLDEVSQFYGGKGKIEGGVENMKGVRFKELFANKALWKRSADYCANDVDEMYRVFKAMVPKMPASEMDLIHLVNRMFCDPVLEVDLPRVAAELKRELKERRETLLQIAEFDGFSRIVEADYKTLLKTKAERELTGEERTLALVKKVVGSSERFADLLRAQDIEPPIKLSPTWMKKLSSERTEEGKWTYAFAKDDLEFVNLPEDIELMAKGKNMNKKSDVLGALTRQACVRALVNARLAVKSTTNITRAQRFLEAGRNGWKLPVAYAYYRAHTGRLGGANKMNMQNLTRGGELRKSIRALKGHMLCVADSGQIEARVNAQLWGEHELLDAFRKADAWDTKTMGVARGENLDAYCRFASAVYGREITTDDKTERFVGKVCVLGLGYQMGAEKLQMTLAKGALGGPPIVITIDEARRIVNTYRSMNSRIARGWDICKRIIEDMAAGRTGSHGPISWEKETIWLPNGMSLKYPDLKKRMGDRGWEEWTYQAKDMRKKIYGGLLCLGADTEVLTDSGWRRLIEVRSNDRVWDGVRWVNHSGVIHKGRKEVIDFGGVKITPDHEVLVGDQWIEAQRTTHHAATSSFTRHHWNAYRDAYSSDVLGQRRTQSGMVDPMRLRAVEDHGCQRVRQGEHQELRMQHEAHPQRAAHNPRDVTPSGLPCVARNAGTMRTSLASCMAQLRRARDHCLRGVAAVRAFLGGHGPGIQAGARSGQARQLKRVLLRELPVGNSAGEHTQQTLRTVDSYPARRNAAMASNRVVGHQESDTVLAGRQRLVICPDVRQTEDVYDIVDAGPLHRFTVRGTDGRPFIVHNCENVVQALARIIVMEQTLAVDKFARVVMSTHDEMVAMVRAAKAEAIMKKMIAAMRTPPKWWPRIPLNAEGGWAPEYSK